MSEYKEQHPLLYNSDEESHLSWHERYRRARHPYGGRAKARVNGAALIIKHWPDHLASLWAYWWTGFGMIAITIFIIYNSVALMDVVMPQSPMVPADVVKKGNVNNVDQNSSSDIYMHIFVSSYEDMEDDFYLKYIETISKKFTDYRYNFIIVLNDRLQSSEKDISPKMKNDIAMKSVLNGDKAYYTAHSSNILVQYISLSNYLDSSPVKSFWRQLPLEILEFLTRCIAIWDKGGIAFDPNIITPLSPNVRYMENLQIILRKHKKYFNRLKHNESKSTMRSQRTKFPRVNNIQDIINILETNNSNGNIPQYNLSEADNKKHFYYIKTTSNRKIDNNGQFKREIIMKNGNFDHEKLQKSNKTTPINVTFNEDNSQKQITGQTNRYKTSQILDDLNENVEKATSVSQAHELVANIIVGQHSSIGDNSTVVDNIDQMQKLIIDLKGNVIASKTPCHAFIGTIFSNIKHYSYNDSLENIITEEVSRFCKGTFSSCKYIDVIFL